jgi:hypothetical protein
MAMSVEGRTGTCDCPGLPQISSRADDNFACSEVPLGGFIDTKQRSERWGQFPTISFIRSRPIGMMIG